jgi:hypothetical protein
MHDHHLLAQNLAVVQHINLVRDGLAFLCTETGHAGLGVQEDPMLKSNMIELSDSVTMHNILASAN